MYGTENEEILKTHDTRQLKRIEQKCSAQEVDQIVGELLENDKELENLKNQKDVLNKRIFARSMRQSKYGKVYNRMK